MFTEKLVFKTHKFLTSFGPWNKGIQNLKHTLLQVIFTVYLILYSNQFLYLYFSYETEPTTSVHTDLRNKISRIGYFIYLAGQTVMNTNENDPHIIYIVYGAIK